MLRLEQIKTISNYARRVIERDTKKLNKDDWIKIGEHLKISPKFERLRPVIAKRHVMSNLELANDRISKVLFDNHITDNTPFEILELAKQIAINKENSGDLIKIAKELIEIKDFKPAKIKITESRQSNSIDYEGLTKVTQTISTTKKLDNSQKENSNKD